MTWHELAGKSQQGYQLGRSRKVKVLIFCKNSENLTAKFNFDKVNSHSAQLAGFFMYLKENNYAFIDSQNLNLAVRSQGWKLDFRRFRIYLKDKYNISKAFLFIGYLPENQSLYLHLQEAGYMMVFKPVLKYPDRGIKGNIDAELVLQVMIEYQNYEKAVIVTGDGDFYCLIDYLNKQGKLLRLLVPNVYKYSKLLKPFAPNKLDFMNNLQRKLEFKNPC